MTFLALSSFYIGGLDVFELDVTVGTKLLTVKNNDPSISTALSSLPALGLPWYDHDGGLYGVTFATDDLPLPGKSCQAVSLACASQHLDEPLSHVAEAGFLSYGKVTAW